MQKGPQGLDGRRVLEVILLASAAGLGASQGVKIARSGITWQSIVILGLAVILVLVGALSNWQRQRSGKSRNENR